MRRTLELMSQTAWKISTETLKNSSRITLSELIVRIIQFESIYNQKDDIYSEEKKKYYEIKSDYHKIPIIKNFSNTYSIFATTKFTNNYYQSQFFKFSQKTKILR